jgi:hypothetical protein
MTRLLQLCFFLAFATCVSVASDIDGTWNFTYLTPDGELRATATLKAEGEKLIFEQGGHEIVGSYQNGEFKVEAKDYYSGEAGYSADLILEGKLEGEEITGKWSFDVYSGTFLAKRPGT